MEKLQVLVKSWWWVGLIAVLAAVILFTDYGRTAIGVSLLAFAAALVVSPRLFGRCCDIVGGAALNVADTAEDWKQTADVRAIAGAQARIAKEQDFLDELSARLNPPPISAPKKKAKRAYTRKPKPILSAETDPAATHPRTDAEASARANA